MEKFLRDANTVKSRKAILRVKKTQFQKDILMDKFFKSQWPATVVEMQQIESILTDLMPRECMR
jgi:hypothetical protein